MRCIVSGTSGYVGGVIARALERRGHDVVRLQRTSDGSQQLLSFDLRRDFDASHFAETAAFVHCAWDMAATSWADISAANIEGSRRILLAAQSAGVPKIVFVSSVSAFPGCRSRYGRAKLAVEETARAIGALVVRPGLVFGDRSGGMVGKLNETVASSSVVPVIAANSPMYCCHEDDLADFVCGYIDDSRPVPSAPFAQPQVAASRLPVTLRRILRTLAARQGRKIHLVPLPWPLVWLALRTLELLGVRAGFKSDSILGAVFTNPALHRNVDDRSGFRSFDECAQSAKGAGNL